MSEFSLGLFLAVFEAFDQTLYEMCEHMSLHNRIVEELRGKEKAELLRIFEREMKLTRAEEDLLASHFGLY